MAPPSPPSSVRPAGRPAPADRPNYWARRLGALAILGIIGYAAVVAIAGFVGGDDGVAESSPDSLVGVSAATAGGADVEADSAEIDCSAEESSELCSELGLADGVTVEEGESTPDGDVETSDGDAAAEEPESHRSTHGAESSHGVHRR